ncbi:hypothetical protein R1flu_021868 [Riccia fluitans]|uniref:Uncharacterized protein n=1 Tax=Riccia fluitans TaxID=41844 RepID=A0ABD1ZQY4_9MARC
MPLHFILKNALLEVEAIARRFFLAQLDTWKENRDALLKWIKSTERNNSLSFQLIISMQDSHFNKNGSQTILKLWSPTKTRNAKYAPTKARTLWDDTLSLHRPRKGPCPTAVIISTLWTAGSPLIPALLSVRVGNTSSTSQLVHSNSNSGDLPLNESSYQEHAQQLIPNQENGEINGPRPNLSAVLHALVVENTGSNSLIVQHTANSGELHHNERSHHEDLCQLIPNYDREELTRNDGNNVGSTSEGRLSDVPTTSHWLNPTLVLESIDTKILGLDLIREEVIVHNQPSINDADNTLVSTALDPCCLACGPTWNEARQEITTSASIRIPIQQNSVPGGRESISDSGEWQASHRPP